MAVSVILVVYNEAKKIARCLESVRWADEIVVIDQSSTDKTVEECRKFTDKVFIVAPKGYCEPDRPVAVSKAMHEWILYVDADEEVTPELRDEIRARLASGPEHDCYYIRRKNLLLGRWIRGSGWDPNYVLRLFKKDGTVFPETIHADIMPRGSSGHLESYIIHHSYDTIEDYTAKLSRYTTVLARQAYDRGKRIRPVTISADFIFLPSAYLFQKLILKRGFRDGLRGYLIAVFTFFTIFLTSAKVWELQNRRS
jgi:glycosyltransferase involved in cell wall biosynthesis